MAGTTLGEYIAKFIVDASGVAGGTRQAESEVKSFKKTLLDAGKALGVAYGVSEAIQYSKAAIDIAEKQSNVVKAFRTTGAAIQDLRQATGGAVNDFSLLQQTVQARNLGLPVERMGEAFKFATIRAAETGEEVDYLTNSIVTGIGRKSPLILDNLGINIAEVRAEFEKTGSFADAVFNVIQTQGQRAVVDIEDVATSAQSLSTAFSNLQAAVGGIFTEAGAGGAAGYFADLIDGLSGDVRGLTGNFIDSSDALATVERQLEETDTVVGKLVRSFLSYSGFPGLQADIVELQVLRDTLIETQQAAARGSAAAEEGRKAFAANYGTLTAESERALETIEGLTSRLQTLEEFRLSAPRQSIASYNQQIEETKRKIEELKSLGLGTADTQLIPKIDPKDINALAVYTATLSNLGENMQKATVQAPNLIQTLTDLGIQFTTFQDISEQGLNQLAVGIGKAFGDAITGTEKFGRSLVKAIAGFMSSIGQQFIAIGASFIAASIAASNPLTGGPGLLLAGTALVALATVLGNVSQSFPGGGSGSSGAGSTRGVAYSASGGNAGGVLGNLELKSPPVYLNNIRVDEALNVGQNINDRLG